MPGRRRDLRNASNLSLKRSLTKKKQKKDSRFTFQNLVKKFHSIIETFPDCRRGKNSRKNLKDAVLAAFAIFFTQNPSFLAFQKQMEQVQGRNNIRTLFGVEELLSDNHIRQLLDPIAPSYLDPLFDYIFNGLKQEGYLEDFRSGAGKRLLLAMDGSRYFSSQKIKCDNCSKTEHSSGGVIYHHDVVMSAIVNPSSQWVIPLSPEFIVPQDGHKKQDCELAAAKRWLHKHSSLTKEKNLTILGDDLYSRQPFCHLLLSQGYHFILVCKPTSHSTLYEYVKLLGDDLETAVEERWKGRKKEIYRYRFANALPLRDGADALEVNWCELEVELEGEGIKYKNAFVTDFPLTRKNVAGIVEDGRCRWKIENENNNVLKNRGYNLEHNFGHGKKNLSALFLTFNLLAFLFHTILELFDEKYSHLRGRMASRKTFFDDLRTLTKFLCFLNWESLMAFMVRALKEPIPMDEIKLYAVYDTS
jgi:hypothetical protein